MDIESDAAFLDQHRAQVGGQRSRNKAHFYPKWIRNNFRSKEEGKEVGEYKDYVVIMLAGVGEGYNNVATEQHKKDYPLEWADYKNGREQRLSGTPIEMLPGLVPSRADSLKAAHIYTIEQMSDLPDAVLEKAGMGAVELRKRAKQYLGSGAAASAESDKKLEELRQEVEKRDAVIAKQHDAMQAMEARIAALETRKKPGRKPKNQIVGVVRAKEPQETVQVNTTQEVT